jgi:putative endonuclease
MDKRLYVYIVKCNDDSYYTGVSNNVEKRVIEHNNSLDKKSYTFFRRPVKLVFSQEFSDPIEAIRFEKQVKGWSRAKKEVLIEGNIEKLVKLSNKKNNRI